MTKSIYSFAKRKASKLLAVSFIVAGTSLFGLPSTYADDTWQANNGNVSGNSVQFDWRGGNATYTTTVPDGSTVTVSINNTIANCIGSCSPIADNWSASINGQSSSGNTIEQTSISTTASGQVTITVSGVDAGFWAGWYGPIFTVSVSSPAPQPVPQVEPTPTPTVEPTPEPSPSVSPEASPSPTPSAEPTSSPSPDVTPTPESSATSVPEPSPVTSSPEPTPIPSPEPSASPVPETPPANNPEPQTQSQSQPEPEPTPSLTPEQIAAILAAQEAAAQLAEEQRIAEEKKIAEEQAAIAEEINDAIAQATQDNGGEVPNLTNVEPEVSPILDSTPPVETSPNSSDNTNQTETSAEPPAPAPTNEDTSPEVPAPVVVIESPVVSVPSVTPSTPVDISTVDVATLPPDALVLLENGVVLTAEVVVSLELLGDPTELVNTLFTDPLTAFNALGNVGADLPPEVRKKAKKVVLAAVIAGNIATSAALAAASPAASYRRKP